MNKKQLAELQSQIDLERQKCADDLNYFINKYIKVVHPVSLILSKSFVRLVLQQSVQPIPYGTVYLKRRSLS